MHFLLFNTEKTTFCVWLRLKKEEFLNVRFVKRFRSVVFIYAISYEADYRLYETLFFLRNNKKQSKQIFFFFFF